LNQAPPDITEDPSTFDGVTKSGRDEDMYPSTPLSHTNLKRFTYPRASNHCPTCSCHHYIITDALLLTTKDKKKASEELFEQESAKKNTTLTDSVFHIKPKPDDEGSGKRKTYLLQFSDKDDQDL